MIFAQGLRDSQDLCRSREHQRLEVKDLIYPFFYQDRKKYSPGSPMLLYLTEASLLRGREGLGSWPGQSRSDSDK